MQTKLMVVNANQFNGCGHVSHQNPKEGECNIVYK